MFLIRCFSIGDRLQPDHRGRPRLYVCVVEYMNTLIVLARFSDERKHAGW